MNKKILCCIAAILTAIIAFTPLVVSRASADTSTALAGSCKSALLVDANSGTVVFTKNESEHLPIASMVKIMTLSLAFDEIEKRGIDLNSNVTASEYAASMGGSQAFLDAGGEYKLGELLKSIVVASANDSCVAVAEYLYGSADGFVAAMNERARALGLSDTAFSNCTGLPKDGQYSCAKDVAVMFKDLIRHQKFFEYAKEWMYDFAHPSGRVTGLTNTNKLIRFYDGCDGGKTGYTDAARSCITVTAKRGDTRLICVAIGAENSKTRNKEVSEMLNYGFANFKTVYALKKGEVMGEYEVGGGKTDKITVIASDEVTAFVNIGDKTDISVQVSVDSLVAPVSAGQVVGKIDVLLNGKVYRTVDAVASDGCEKKGYIDILDDFVSEW